MRVALAAVFAAVFALAFASQAARAEGIYFTETIGGTNVKDELAAHLDGGFRIRGALGYRIDKLAFELWGSATINTGGYDYDNYEEPSPAACEITTPDKYGGCTEYPPNRTGSGSARTDFASWGMDVKYMQPVAKHVEVYLRGGLSKGYADGLDASGRGIGVGAGIQVKGKVPVVGLLFWPLFFTGLGPKITGALYIDSSYEFYRLHGPQRTTDAQLSHLSFGFALGSDF